MDQEEVDDFGEPAGDDATNWAPAGSHLAPTSQYDEFLRAREHKVVVKAPEKPQQGLDIRTIRHNLINEGLDRMTPLSDFAPPVQFTPHVKAERGLIGSKWKEQDPVFDPFYQPPGEFPNGIIPELTNVVATASLACEIDLRAAAVKLPNCEYDPRVRPGLVLRIREPQATCILHAKGRMKVMGCKTEYAARQAIRKFARKLQRAATLSTGIVRGEVKISKFGIQNIAANVDIGFPISSLERFATEFDNEAIYEPEIGSCVTVTSESPRLTMQIFASGKIVFLGARHRLHIYEAFRQWFPRLSQFKASDRFSGMKEEEGFAEELPESAKLEAYGLDPRHLLPLLQQFNARPP